MIFHTILNLPDYVEFTKSAQRGMLLLQRPSCHCHGRSWRAQCPALQPLTLQHPIVDRILSICRLSFFATFVTSLDQLGICKQFGSSKLVFLALNMRDIVFYTLVLLLGKFKVHIPTMQAVWVRVYSVHISDIISKILHTGNTWPSCMCVIQEYWYYTMCLSLYNESLSIP